MKANPKPKTDENNTHNSRSAPRSLFGTAISAKRNDRTERHNRAFRPEPLGNLQRRRMHLCVPRHRNLELHGANKLDWHGRAGLQRHSLQHGAGRNHCGGRDGFHHRIRCLRHRLSGRRCWLPEHHPKRLEHDGRHGRVHRNHWERNYPRNNRRPGTGATSEGGPLVLRTADFGPSRQIRRR